MEPGNGNTYIHKAYMVIVATSWGWSMDRFLKGIAMAGTPVENLWRGALRAARRFAGNDNPSEEVRQLASMVPRLLSHYWTADDAEQMREQQVYDWLRDLSAFPLDIVAQAIDERRREPGSRRPTPGDVYARCIVLHNEARERSLYRALPPRSLSFDDVADGYAVEQGYTSMAEWQSLRSFRSVVVRIGNQEKRYESTYAGPIGERPIEPVPAWKQAGEKVWSKEEMARARRQLGLI